MDYTELNNCIEILKKKPVWFFSKENIKEKLECLEKIQARGDSFMIHQLLGFLNHDNNLIKAKATETVLYFFKRLHSINDYSGHLRYLPIHVADLKFYITEFDKDIAAQLLGIASFNRDGHVRERAVRNLADLKNEYALKFILLRLGDWVSQVRKAAKDAVTIYLDEEYLSILVNQLPTIDWLLNVGRVDLKEIHNEIIQFIFDRKFNDRLYKLVNGLNEKVRLRYYKHLLANQKLSGDQVKSIVLDKSFLVRGELLKHLPAFDTSTQKELIASLLNDQSAAVRQQAMYASKPFSPQFDSQIMNLLSDESASVRELSRHLLKGKIGDYATLYRQRIAGKQLLAGSLSGLNDTGNEADLPVFGQYIDSNNKKLIIPSLSAINKYNKEKARTVSLKLLANRSKKTRNKAIEILVKHRDNETLEAIRTIYLNGDYETKKTVLMLFNRIGGWNIIADLLLALTDKNPNIQNIAWSLLHKWHSYSIRLFTTPPKTELDRARKIISNLDDSKLIMARGREKLLQDLRFILR